MKIILTGSSGFAGSTILTQCIAHHYITHIFVLTRRPLDSPAFTHKKVTQILHEDFEQWPAELLARFRDEGVTSCIWSLGGKVKDLGSLDNARKVNVNYVAAAAEALSRDVAPSLEIYDGYPDNPPKAGASRFPFRFVYVSGWGAEQDQFRKLWVQEEDRKIKGAAERAIFATADGSQEKEKENRGVIGSYKCFEVIALRPGGILSGDTDAMGTILRQAIIPSVSRDQLAKMAIRVAFNGSKDKRILENKDILGDEWGMVNSLGW